LREELEAQAKALGLFPAVIFTGMRKDIPDILNALDVLVLSSLWEGLPVILLEAMAAARPIVSTAVDGVQGVLIPNETALLVKTQRPDELANACLILADDPQLRSRLGMAGFRRVSEFYSIDSMINRISDLYQELLRDCGLAGRQSLSISEPEA
jgi:glycosyltransferase involved in cell wall biosynthesis